MTDKKAMQVLDLTAYTRKVPVKKKPEDLGRFAKHLLGTFTMLVNNYARIDNIFDPYIFYTVSKKWNRT